MFASKLVFSSDNMRFLRTAIAFCIVTASAALFFSYPMHAQATTATAGDKQEVLASVQRLFDGLAKHDQTAMLAEMLPAGSATLYRNGDFLIMSLRDLAERVARVTDSPDKYEERIHDPLIRIDDNIAVVWAPYVFLKNGTVDHCGTDLLSLIHSGGRWVIASVSDNSRKDCAAK